MPGHIRYRGKTKTGRHRYLVTVETGRDAGGGRIRKTKTVYGDSKREARERAQSLLNAWLAELDQGTYVEPSSMTLRQYLRHWLEHAAPSLAPRTVEGYRYIIESHLIPALGHIPLSKLTPLAIQNYYARALRDGRKDGAGGLSNRSVEFHHAVLRRALGQAVRWRLLAQNPCLAVDPPRAGRRHDMTILGPEQVKALLEAAAKTRDYALILTAVTTGLRRGELLALRWDDVDLQRRVIHVRHALQRIKGRGLVLREPKTVRSRRQVSLPESTVEALRRLRAEQARNRLRLGPRYQDNGLVFCLPDGRPLDPPGLTRRFRRLADGLGFTTLRFHDLRHTHASMLLAQGVHPKVVQDRLGHESIQQTIDTYSHLFPDLQREAAAQVDQWLFGRAGRQLGDRTDTP